MAIALSKKDTTVNSIREKSRAFFYKHGKLNECIAFEKARFERDTLIEINKINDDEVVKKALSFIYCYTAVSNFDKLNETYNFYCEAYDIDEVTVFHDNYAISLTMLGHHETAISLYKDRIERGHVEIEIIRHLAKLYNELGRFQEEQNLLKKFSKLKIDDFEESLHQSEALIDFLSTKNISNEQSEMYFSLVLDFLKPYRFDDIDVKVHVSKTDSGSWISNMLKINNPVTDDQLSDLNDEFIDRLIDSELDNNTLNHITSRFY